MAQSAIGFLPLEKQVPLVSCYTLRIEGAFSSVKVGPGAHLFSAMNDPPRKKLAMKFVVYKTRWATRKRMNYALLRLVGS